MFKQKREKYHLLKKIANRELSGSFVPNRSFHTRHAKAQELFKDIPNRCTYQLSELIQLGRHVFMGMTRCGRFLLTYSYLTSPSLLSASHEYRLHWWLYHPFKQASKVAEVKLFSDQAINNIVSIGIAQWPNVNNHLIVYGYSACSDEDHILPFSRTHSDPDQRRYYFTITTLPSTNDCRECKSVAASFNEEDMAANWDSCVGLSCLKHSLTVHTSFDVLYPFPMFHSYINLKLDNRLIFNSGNFLHVIYVEMENDNIRLRSNQPKDTITPDKINHKVGKSLFFNYPKEYLLPLNVAQAYQIHQTISLYQQQQSAEQRASRRWCNRIPNLAMKPVPIKTKAWRRTISDQAEKVYAFEEAEDGCEPKLKWYRRKRLADKMYEFCSDEEDMENIQPEGKNKLPRYKFSSPSPEKNKMTTNCHFGDKTDHSHQISPLKLDSINHPFTKMMINNRARLDRSSKDCNNKTEQDPVINQFLDLNDECSNSGSVNFDDRDKALSHQSQNLSKVNSTDLADKVVGDCQSNLNTSSVLSPLFLKTVIPSNSSDTIISFPVDNSNSTSSNCDMLLITEKKLDSNNRLGASNEFLNAQQLSIRTSEESKDYERLCDNNLGNNRIESSNSKIETVLDIIKEWEVDSVSSLSPRCYSDTWVPNPSDIKRHNAIQRFLEIPQRTQTNVKSNIRNNPNCNSRKRLFEWWSSNYPNRHRKLNASQNPIKSISNAIDRGPDKSLSPENPSSKLSNTCQSCEANDCSNAAHHSARLSLFPKIKVILRPCNRNKHSSAIADNKQQSCLTDPNSDDEKLVNKSATSPAKDDLKPKGLNKAMKEQLNEAFSHHLIQGCSVQLDRRYIEVDEEMISTITDIEDDDQSSIGFHCALPIVVHGSAYSQLQMVSNSKADKLNVPSVFVRQSSLDIEPLCHHAANIICECQGYKFWSLNDYETEIINICPSNCDILFLVHMKLNVEPRYDRLITSNLNRIHQPSKQLADNRDYYECRCIFIWNPETNTCHLEAYTTFTNALTNVSSFEHDNSNRNNLTLAQSEALKLRKTASIGLFSYNSSMPVRNLDHQLYDDEYNLVETVHEIRDPTNLIVITLDRPGMPDSNLSHRNVIELM